MKNIKKIALAESIANVLSGFVLTILIFQPFIFWIYGLELQISDNIVIAAYFTIIGILRSYLWRIYFHKWFYK